MEAPNSIVTYEILASKGKRLGNHVIDLIPQYGIMYVISYGFFYIGEFTGNYTLNDYWNELSVIEDYSISYVLLVLYYFIFETLTHRSLGKYVTNTKIVMHNGEEPKPKAIMIRSLCRLIPFDALSFLGTNGKGWHDNLSNTYVVDITAFESKKTSLNELDQIGLPVE